ncbi:hypothetical protein HaLaN_17805 [Haematococcus lacustris]|uniref:Uncharacterized protein n=1 Tax=Haematococcus lacustris TaxID=44745 RepID=A0A699ZHN9_HAELA|nr:hypothetical protein HaLaN_17805 [Haematococcus lacustris]
MEVLRRCAEAGYRRLDSHGRPMGSMAEQLSPAPSPADIFTSTQEAPVGRPAALSKCRHYVVSEQCVLPNPHRPGKTSTVGHEFLIVSTYMRHNTLDQLLRAKAIHLQFHECTCDRHGKDLILRVTAAVLGAARHGSMGRQAPKCHVTPAGPATCSYMQEMQCHSCLSGRRVSLHHGLSPLASCSRTTACCSGSAWWQWLGRASWCPQQQLTPAGTTPELAVPAGAPPQQQQQLAVASTSRKHEAPAANKSRAAEQGETIPRTAPSTMFKRSSR